MNNLIEFFKNTSQTLNLRVQADCTNLTNNIQLNIEKNSNNFPEKIQRNKVNNSISNIKALFSQIKQNQQLSNINLCNIIEEKIQNIIISDLKVDNQIENEIQQINVIENENEQNIQQITEENEEKKVLKQQQIQNFKQKMNFIKDKFNNLKQKWNPKQVQVVEKQQVLTNSQTMDEGIQVTLTKFNYPPKLQEIEIDSARNNKVNKQNSTHSKYQSKNNMDFTQSNQPIESLSQFTHQQNNQLNYSNSNNHNQQSYQLYNEYDQTVFSNLQQESDIKSNHSNQNHLQSKPTSQPDSQQQQFKQPIQLLQHQFINYHNSNAEFNDQNDQNYYQDIPVVQEEKKTVKPPKVKMQTRDNNNQVLLTNYYQNQLAKLRREEEEIELNNLHFNDREKKVLSDYQKIRQEQLRMEEAIKEKRKQSIQNKIMKQQLRKQEANELQKISRNFLHKLKSQGGQGGLLSKELDDKISLVKVQDSKERRLLPQISHIKRRQMFEMHLQEQQEKVVQSEGKFKKRVIEDRPASYQEPYVDDDLIMKNKQLEIIEEYLNKKDKIMNKIKFHI